MGRRGPKIFEKVQEAVFNTRLIEERHTSIVFDTCYFVSMFSDFHSTMEVSGVLVSLAKPLNFCSLIPEDVILTHKGFMSIIESSKPYVVPSVRNWQGNKLFFNEGDFLFKIKDFRINGAQTCQTPLNKIAFSERDRVRKSMERRRRGVYIPGF